MNLIECGICSHIFLPIAHHDHCPNCGAMKMIVAHKPFYVNVVTGRQIAKPFSLTRSLAETINKLSQGA